MEQQAKSQSESYEVAIVGGGPAGLSAALVLGRARRRTVLFDAGNPRNAPAHSSHSFFTRDGAPPSELIRTGREQLATYRSVELRAEPIADAKRLPDGFQLFTADGREIRAAHLILATGVVDDLPDVPGLRQLWGTGVFHCPYCHGWEVRDEPFVLIAHDARSFHLAQAIRGWSRNVTICPTGRLPFDDQQRATLLGLGAVLKPQPVAELIGDGDGRVADVVLADGERLGPAAVFVAAAVRQRSPLPEKLGCTLLTDGPFAGRVKIDERCSAGVPGLYVVGDASQGNTQIVNAAYEGATAAIAINNELLLSGRPPAATEQGDRTM